MEWVLGILGLAVAAWIIAEPFLRAREAKRTGTPSLPFSRMLIRMVVAFCVACIVLLMVLSPFVLPGKSALAQLLYWLGALFLALVMLVAGVTEMALVKKHLLEQQKELVREIVRPRKRPVRPKPQEGKPARDGGNGSKDRVDGA